MTKPSFKKDIIPIFAKYVQDMKDIQVSDHEGTLNLRLDDCAIVRRFATKIQYAIHGYDFLPSTNPTNPPKLRPGAKPLPKPGSPGEYVTYVAHAMPANPDDNMAVDMVRLPQEAIDLFDAWIEAGMQD